MKHCCNALLLGSILLMIVGCGGASPESQPTAASQAASPTIIAPTATLVISNSGGGRRAPTLAPTEAATSVPSATVPIPTNSPPPTATNLPPATATNQPSSTSTLAAPQALTKEPAQSSATTAPTTALPRASATPQLAAAVYVTALSVDPPEPKSKPAQFLFHVSFLNTVGENVNYPQWRVLIFRKGEAKAIGDVQGESKTIVNGASEQNTQLSSINAPSVCDSYVAQPVWEDEDGKRVPFPKPDGSSGLIDFQVCP